MIHTLSKLRHIPARCYEPYSERRLTAPLHWTDVSESGLIYPLGYWQKVSLRENGERSMKHHGTRAGVGKPAPLGHP